MALDFGKEVVDINSLDNFNTQQENLNFSDDINSASGHI